MYEIFIALSYVVPKKNTISTAMVGLFATFVISVIVWVILVFFSVNERFETRWSEHIRLLLGSAQIIPNQNGYLQLDENRIDIQSLEANYSARRLSDIKYRPQFVWNESFDTPLSSLSEQEEYTAIFSGTKKRIALAVEEKLHENNIQISDFESIVGQLSLYIPQSHTESQNTPYEVPHTLHLKKDHKSDEKEAQAQSPVFCISQYSYIIGRSLFSLPKKASAISWSTASVAKYLALLACSIRGENRSEEHGRLVEQTALPGVPLFNIYTAFPFESTIQITNPDFFQKYSLDSIQRSEKAECTFFQNDEEQIYAAVTPYNKNQKTIFIPFSKNFLTSIRLVHVAVMDENKKERYCGEKKSLGISSTNSTSLYASLPLDYIHGVGYPIYLPQQMKKQGVELFTQGTLSLPTVEQDGSSYEEKSQKEGLPLIVCGFFDTGILSIGGRIGVLSSQAVTSLDSKFPLQSDFHSQSGIIVTGICNDALLSETSLTQKISDSLRSIRDTTHAFSIHSYKEYDTTKELFNQLNSEKNLFRLISCILLTAASSNIFSMLFILVHTQAKEIAIMRAIGATKKSITLIFSLAGAMLGLAGAILGTIFASITLYFLPEIMHALTTIQGQEVLQSAIYGKIERSSLSYPVFLMTFLLTSLISLFAGYITSVKACKITICDALKSS